MLTPKQVLRDEMVKLRQSFTLDDVVGRSQIICKSLEQTDLFQAAHCVALYCATGFEVQTSGLMEAWGTLKQIVLPVISGKNMHFYPFTGTENLKKGAFGIPEPISKMPVPPESDLNKPVSLNPISCCPVPPEPDLNEPVSPNPISCGPVPPEAIDLFVVPGIAFDRVCNRLGRGKGYYDRYLSGLNKPTIGLCFDFQLIEHIPCEMHDKKMTLVISESFLISAITSEPACL